MSRGVAPRLAALAGLLMLIGLIARPMTAQEAKDPPAPKRPESLILLVRDTDGLPPVEIANTLKKGMISSGCACDGEIQPRPISSVVYNSLTSVQELALPAQEKKDFNIQPAPEVPGIWLVSHKPNFTLTKMKVEVESPKADGKGKEQRVRVLTPSFRQPASAGKELPTDPPLTMLLPSMYSLRLEANETPLSYEATLMPNKKGEKEWQVEKTNFPRLGDAYYLIVLKNFSGDRKTLFNVIRNAKLVANPVRSIQEAQEMSLVFAAWGMDQVGPGEYFNGLNYTPQINVPDTREAEKVYIRFPLTEKEYEAEAKKYQTLDSVNLIDEIKKEKVVGKDDKFTVSPKSKPQWIELPAMPGTNNRRFSRNLPLEDVKGLQESFPKIYRLVVWEFNGQAVLVQQMPEKRSVPALREEVPEWPRGIAATVEREKKKKK